jgi:hypothetical protein
MIIATITKQWVGDPTKGEHPFNIFTQLNFSTDGAIPALGYKAGDIIQSTQIVVSDLDELYKQVGNWVATCERRIANLLLLKSKPVEQAIIVEPSLYKFEPPVVDEEALAKQQAEQEYQQKRQALIQAKQDLEVELITQEEYAAIQSSALSAKAIATWRPGPVETVGIIKG